MQNDALIKWEEKTLFEISDIETGKWDANHATINGIYRFYTCASTPINCDTYSFDGECLIFPGNGANVGDVYYYKGKFDAYQRTYVVSNIKDVCVPYLYYYLQCFWRERNRNKQFGSATNYIKIGNFKDFIVQYPSRAEQERIVKILDEAFENIDKAKQNAEQNLNNAKELFESYLDRVFTEDTNNWNHIKIGQILTLEYGKELDKKDRNTNGFYNVYGANGIKTKSNKFLYDKQSIIVGRKGSAGEINISDDKFWALDVCYYTVFDSNKYDLHFLYYLLSKQNLKELAKGIKPGLNRNEVYAIEVKVPIIKEQQKIVQQLDELQEQTKQLEKIYEQKIKDLDELKQSILQKAFNGEL